MRGTVLLRENKAHQLLALRTFINWVSIYTSLTIIVNPKSNLQQKSYKGRHNDEDNLAHYGYLQVWGDIYTIP